MSSDHNAALNILARGREIGQELPKFWPVEEKASTQSQLVEQVFPAKQEASLLVGRSFTYNKSRYGVVPCRDTQSQRTSLVHRLSRARAFI